MAGLLGSVRLSVPIWWRPAPATAASRPTSSPPPAIAVRGRLTRGGCISWRRADAARAQHEAVLGEFSARIGVFGFLAARLVRGRADRERTARRHAGASGRCSARDELLEVSRRRRRRRATSPRRRPAVDAEGSLKYLTRARRRASNRAGASRSTWPRSTGSAKPRRACAVVSHDPSSTTATPPGSSTRRRTAPAR